MHNMHIVDIITKIARQNPEHRQELIDLATLGYRDGLITGKIKAVAEEEDMDPEELDENELLPQELDEITESTENWFRELMMVEAKNMNMLNEYHDMLNSVEPEEVDGGQEYMDMMGYSPEEFMDAKERAKRLVLGKVDLGEFIKNFKNTSPQPRNRVKADMDKLNKENPGLFD